MVGHAAAAAAAAAPAAAASSFLCHMPGCGWNASTQISERCCQTAPPAPTAKPSTPALHCTRAFSPSFRLCPPGFGAAWIQAWHAGHLMLCFALPCLGPRLCLASALHCVGQGRGAARPQGLLGTFLCVGVQLPRAAKLPVNLQLQPPLLGLGLRLLVLGVRPPPPPSSCFVLLVLLVLAAARSASVVLV